jgi:hypothetical protein
MIEITHNTIANFLLSDSFTSAKLEYPYIVNKIKLRFTKEDADYIIKDYIKSERAVKTRIFLRLLDQKGSANFYVIFRITEITEMGIEENDSGKYYTFTFIVNFVLIPKPTNITLH